MGKKMRKAAIILLSILFVFSITMAFACSEDENTKPEEHIESTLTLITNEITLDVGGTTKIGVVYDGKSNLMFSSSDQNCVSVDNNGLITGINSGIAFITIKADNKTQICKIIVRELVYSVGLDYTSIVIPQGSKYKFTARPLLNGENYSDSISWTASKKDGEVSDGVLEIQDNLLNFNANEQGDYVITAKSSKAQSTCNVKVVSINAKVLDTPQLNIENCKHLSWNAVSDASYYYVKVRGYDWIRVDGTAFDLTDYITGNKLKDGARLVVDVMAMADGDYEHINSYIGSISSVHNYNSVIKTEGTCENAGVKTFTCTVCGNSYEDEYFAHEYAQGFCVKCHNTYTPSVTYEFDDNYIPMPTPMDAEDPNSAWRQKYDKYIIQYADEVKVDLDNKKATIMESGKEKTVSLKTNYFHGWSEGRAYYEVLWNAVNTIKANIASTDREVCYYVTGVSDGRASSIYLAGVYNDGINGQHEVKYIKQDAFTKNETLRRVELAENIVELRGRCFYDCRNLQTVIAPGITFLPQITFVKGYYHDNFTNAYGMRDLVLGDGAYIDGRNFHPYTDSERFTLHQLDIYIDGITPASMSYFWEVQSSHSGIFSGSYFYKDDRDDGYECGTWCYDDNNDIMLNHHDYSSNGVDFECRNCHNILKCGEKYYDYNGNVQVREHNFYEDTEKCVFCGALDPKGLIYKYDESIDGYAVIGYEYVSSVLRVPDKYDDGRNGLKDVKVIGEKAFKGNKSITHVVLPDTVNYIAGSSFESMPNLTFISMTGVSELPYDENKNVNHFVDDFKLETVIIKKDFNIQTQCFIDNPVDGISCVGFTIYAYEPSGNINFINVAGKGINNMWNGNIVYYDATLSKCGSWRFADGGLMIERNNNTPIDNDGDGYCDHDGCKGVIADYTKAITYYFDNDTNEYYVIRNKNLNIETVIVPATFNDGVHGEHPVTTIGKSAFEYNDKITRIVLPESVTKLCDSAFSSMPNLRYISMIGVSEITANDGTNQFVDDTALEFVIIKKDFKVNGQSFYDRIDTTPNFSIYAMEPGGTIIIPTSKNNNMWNNELYIYSTGDVSRCFSWKYGEDGITIIKSTSSPVDNDGDGYCDHPDCAGVIVDLSKAITYAYDEETSSYYVTKNTALAPDADNNGYVVCQVASEFDDGVHGRYPVTAISDSAFEYNKEITHIVLPESVTRLGQFAFAAMQNLQTVVMPGVAEIKTTDEDKQFHGSINLRKIVVGQNFDVSRMSLNLDSKDHHTSSYQNLITIYSTTIGGAIQINNWDGRNDGWNGKVIYCWEYESDTFEPVELSEHKYLDKDGNCEFCNKCFERTTLATYAWEESSNSYIISDDGNMTFLGNDGNGRDYNGNVISTAVRIPSWYNDGVHGDARVTAVGVQAFESNPKLTAIVLPETVTNIHALAFNDCKVLKTVHMTGVTSLTDKDDDRQFRACAALRSVIVGQNFNATRRTLKINDYSYNYDPNNPQEYDDRITVYSTTIGGNIWLTKEYQARNSSWNGEICYCWEWADEEGIEPVKSDIHKYIGDDGECEYCNHIFHKTGTPHYAWDEMSESYYISGDGMTFGNDEDGNPVPTDLVIPSWYNDGVHGDARVTRVAAGALNTNSKVTSIKLPSTITTLGRMCFANMTKLKTVSITGDLYLTNETSGDGLIFEGSTSLVNLILGPNVFVEEGVYFVRRSGTPNATLNVFCTDDSGEETGTARDDGLRNLYLPYLYNYDKNETINGKIFYYYRATQEEYESLESNKKANAWRYGEDGFTPVRWIDYLGTHILDLGSGDKGVFDNGEW